MIHPFQVMGVLNTRADQNNWKPVVIKKSELGDEALNLLDKYGFYIRPLGIGIDGEEFVHIYHPEASDG